MFVGTAEDAAAGAVAAGNPPNEDGVVAAEAALADAGWV
jgi:hypothetical protein